MKPTLHELSAALQASWSADTSYTPSEWNLNNKARGQCTVSSLIVQDYFGGELIRYEISSDMFHETHYMNQLPDGMIIDTTGKQYSLPINMRRIPLDTSNFTSFRKKCLSNESTATRYIILKHRVEQILFSQS